MTHLSASGGLPDFSTDFEPDKRWLGTLLCCLSAIVTTVLIVLVTSAFMSTDDRDIARSDSQVIDRSAPTEGNVDD